MSDECVTNAAAPCNVWMYRSDKYPLNKKLGVSFWSEEACLYDRAISLYRPVRVVVHSQSYIEQQMECEELVSGC